MGNGGVRDSLRIQIFDATTSTSPVARFGIDGAGAARLDLAFDGDHVLRPHLFGALVHRRLDVLVEDDLGQAVAVAQIDEDHAAMIAAAMHPAHQQHGLALVGGAQVRRRYGCGEGRPENPVRTEVSISNVSQFRVAASCAAISSCVSFCCSPVDIFFSA